MKNSDRYIIREANKNDAEPLEELWREMMDFHKVLNPFFTLSSDGREKFQEFILDHIERDSSLVLVATSEDAPIGYCLATIAEYPPFFANFHYGSIKNFTVAGKHRRKGVGTQLFEKVVPWFQEKGITRIELLVEATNEFSQAFWKKLGFRDLMRVLTKDI